MSSKSFVSSRPSGRILVNKDGVHERIEVDASPDADNSRALKYDTAPGRTFNAKRRRQAAKGAKS